MSSGGQRGIDVSGNGNRGVGARIMSASDVTIDIRRSLTFVTNNAIATANIPAWSSRNALQNHTPNGNNFVQDFILGRKECDCSGGMPIYQPGNITKFS
jgi:hypothetical protein